MTMSSRRDALFGGIVPEGDKLVLRFWAGCKVCVAGSELLSLVAATHGDNTHAQQYRAAIAYIEMCFNNDMDAHVWDYLLEL